MLSDGGGIISESGGDYFSELGGEIISESGGGLPRNLHKDPCQARFREAAPTGRGRKVPNDPLTEVPRDAMWPARHDLHHNAAEPRSGARAAIIDRSSASRRRAWLVLLVFLARSRGLSASKAARKEIAEPIANLQFAPSVQIRRLLRIPRVNFNEAWYKSSLSAPLRA
ncbi:hypothetical protein [Sinorhizobium meliloti]|uniref:hypothetical protein n=2 Tax=Rhizobium meliloti TaxID=382 RepID=UPI001F29E886|nr:hypothetical protein [Sinorhizobium meliloti]